ncbi:MAG: AMP-binding protein, partial [Planctomycetota bacterium]
MTEPAGTPREPALHPILPLPARPDGAAVVLEHGGARIRCAQLLGATAHALEWLRAQGVSAGDRVALQADKGLPFVACHLACLRLGAIG